MLRELLAGPRRSLSSNLILAGRQEKTRSFEKIFRNTKGRRPIAETNGTGQVIQLTSYLSITSDTMADNGNPGTGGHIANLGCRPRRPDGHERWLRDLEQSHGSRRRDEGRDAIPASPCRGLYGHRDSMPPTPVRRVRLSP